MIFALAIATGLGAFMATSALLIGPRIALADRLMPVTTRNSIGSEIFARARSSTSRLFASKSRLRAALLELPEILELMVLVLSAGEGIFAALARVTPRARGVLASEFGKVIRSLEFGGDLESELNALASRLPQRHVVEFSHKLALASRRGAPSAQMLSNLAASARSEIRNEKLRQAGKNETRMLIPLVFMILPVTILFAIYPSLHLLQTEYL
jgi:tight adherence protein C